MISRINYESNDYKKLQILEVKLVDNSFELISDGIISTSQVFCFEVIYNFKELMPKCHLTYIIKNSLGEVVLFVDRTDFYKQYFVAEAKTYKAVIKIQNPLLKPGIYYVSFGLADQYSNSNDHKFDVLKFKIEDLDSIRTSRQGDLFLPTEWEMKTIQNEENYF